MLRTIFTHNDQIRTFYDYTTDIITFSFIPLFLSVLWFIHTDSFTPTVETYFLIILWSLIGIYWSKYLYLFLDNYIGGTYRERGDTFVSTRERIRDLFGELKVDVADYEHSVPDEWTAEQARQNILRFTQELTYDDVPFSRFEFIDQDFLFRSVNLAKLEDDSYTVHVEEPGLNPGPHRIPFEKDFDSEEDAKETLHNLCNHYTQNREPNYSPTLRERWAAVKYEIWGVLLYCIGLDRLRWYMIKDSLPLIGDQQSN